MWSSPQMHDSHRLTKRFFMSLETGVFLVSNCYHVIDRNTSAPSFSEYVLPAKNREEQWKRIKAVNADQRHCVIYLNAEECIKSLESLSKQDESYPNFILKKQNHRHQI